MIQEQSKQILSGPEANRVVQGDCIEVLRGFGSRSVDFVLTDPPYLAHYCSRDGRRAANDGDAGWLKPAFAERGGCYHPIRLTSGNVEGLLCLQLLLCGGQQSSFF